MKFTTVLAVTMASLAIASPVANPEPEPNHELETRWSAWAFYVSGGSKCGGVIYSDAGTSASGCKNINGKTGASVQFTGSSWGGAEPVGTFYASANCAGASVSAKADQCVAGTIKSYKVSA